jgi:hypothetical protein
LIVDLAVDIVADFGISHRAAHRGVGFVTVSLRRSIIKSVKERRTLSQKGIGSETREELVRV